MARPRRAETQPPRWSEALRALREARGVSQGGWAAWLGVGRNTVQRWENGEAVPNLHVEAALEAVLHERGLFRAYDQGPLRGVTVTPEYLRDLLAGVRLATAAGTAATPSATAFAHAAATAAPASTPPPDTNLPAAATSFVGREAERGDILFALVALND